MRIFISLPIPKEVKTQLKNTQKQIQANNKTPKVKWTEPSKMHVTLKFIGDLEKDELEQLSTLIKQAAEPIVPFKFSFFKLDAFPSLDNPSVLINKLKELNGRNSFELEQNLRSYLDKNSLPYDNKKWIPHITLGRIQKDNSEIRLPNLDIDYSFKVDEVEIKKSKLKPSGPEYKTLESIKL
ncbi:MAG: RNA 2',3'-cyclic phosphodiesterase [Candidatus Paceibacteria bacterium]